MLTWHNHRAQRRRESFPERAVTIKTNCASIAWGHIRPTFRNNTTHLESQPPYRNSSSKQQRGRQHKIVGTDESVIPHTPSRNQPLRRDHCGGSKCLTSEKAATAIGPSSVPNKQQAHSALESQLWVRLAFFWPPPPPCFWPPPPPPPCLAQRSSGHSDRATGDTNKTEPATVAVTSGIHKQSKGRHTTDGINTKSSAPMRT
jgi:hypothetical protein